MIIALAITVFCTIPPDLTVTDQVDRVEINRYYDDNASHIFDQAIFYDWCYSTNRFQVRAWRLIRSPAQLPQRDFLRGGYNMIWHDGEILRRIHARTARETWSQHDREIVERRVLADRYRQPLTPYKPWPICSPDP